jgi:hypothetical protein
MTVSDGRIRGAGISPLISIPSTRAARTGIKGISTPDRSSPAATTMRAASAATVVPGWKVGEKPYVWVVVLLPAIIGGPPTAVTGAPPGGAAVGVVIPPGR